MTKLDNVIKTREDLERQLQKLEATPDLTLINVGIYALAMEQLRFQIQALRWAERIVRAALVVDEERTPDGVSDTIIDELCKATRS